MICFLILNKYYEGKTFEVEDNSNLSISKQKKLKKEDRKKTRKNYDLVTQSKTYWEQIRDKENISDSDRKKLISELLSSLKDQMMTVCFFFFVLNNIKMINYFIYHFIVLIDRIFFKIIFISYSLYFLFFIDYLNYFIVDKKTRWIKSSSNLHQVGNT